MQGRRQMQSSKIFKNILIIYNPASTNSKRVQKRLAEIENLLPEVKITTIQTSPKGRQATQKAIVSKSSLLGPDTLLCIAAGDGTVNVVIETLMLSENLTPNMRKTPILPLWGGNANDLAHMLNGYSQTAKLENIFKVGKIVEINPLKITLINKGDTNVRIAACYASFGATAFAANHINRPAHRGKKLASVPVMRLIAEASTIGRAFVNVSKFKIHEDDKHHNLYEYALINGSRIAKFERVPIRLTDNAFYMIKVTRKHPIVLLYLLQLLKRRRFGRITSKQRIFEIKQQTWLQLDGEVIKVEAGTQIKAELNKQPFYALSKRLRKK